MSFLSKTVVSIHQCQNVDSTQTEQLVGMTYVLGIPAVVDMSASAVAQSCAGYLQLSMCACVLVYISVTVGADGIEEWCGSVGVACLDGML